MISLILDESCLKNVFDLFEQKNPTTDVDFFTYSMWVHVACFKEEFIFIF